MKRGVTIKDIASHLGISARSVSQALSGVKSTSKVSAVKRERIVRVAREMGYRPDRAARALRTGRSGVIGILAFGYQHPFVTQRLEAVLAEVRDCGYVPFAHLAGGSADDVGDALDAMLDARVEGIVAIQPVEVTKGEFVKGVSSAGIPMVAVGGHWLSSVPCYLPDKRSDFRVLVDHVVEQGCRSLVFVLHARPEYATGVDLHHHDEVFVAGFRSGIRAACRGGLKVTGKVHRVARRGRGDGSGGVHWLYAPGYHAMLSILDRGNLPDAVLFQGDVWAQGGLRACMERGVIVPRDIVIVGYDDDPGSSAGAIPLTTVAQSHTEISRMAVGSLVRQIRTGVRPKLAPVTIPGRLVVRQSSMRTGRR